MILSIEIPFLAADEQVKTFKIMPRHQVQKYCADRSVIPLGFNTNDVCPIKNFLIQSAHAYVNAGFRAAIDGNLTIKGTPSLVFGGVKLAPVSDWNLEKEKVKKPRLHVLRLVLHRGTTSSYELILCWK